MAPKVAKATKKVAKATKTGEKKAPSAYINFCKENREKAKAKNPSATFGELGKILGTMWGALTDKEKAAYKK